MHPLILKLEQGAAHVMDAPQVAHVVGAGTVGVWAGKYFEWIPDALLAMSNYAAIFGLALTIVLIWRHITLTRIAIRDSARRDKESVYREVEHNLTVQRLREELQEAKADVG